MKKQVSIPKLRCYKCGHRWVPRLSLEPDMCPKCKSKKWNEAENGKH